MQKLGLPTFWKCTHQTLELALVQDREDPRAGSATSPREMIRGFSCEEREYSILPVMSELSTVRYDRAFGHWIAGTRALSVDEELP